jgi:predicted dehydrogenase
MRRREFLAATVAATVSVAVRGGESAAPLRVAVIGQTGRGNYGHGLDTMWRRLPETTIVAVADADAKGLEEALKKLGVTRGFHDYRLMLAETKPDIVAIAPRHVDQHRDMILAAVAAGVRGIYLEKPFCRTPAEADEIIAACEARNVRLAVAHRNRWHPVLPVLQQLISNGAIGRVLEIRARGKEDHRGGALDLWVLGSHLFNLATVFAGVPVACTATLLQGGRLVTRVDVTAGAEGVGPLAGDEVHARFEMASGIPVFFDSIKGAGVPAAGFGIQIVGTQGVFDLRVDEEPVAHYLAGNPFQPVQDARRWVPVTTAGIGQPEPISELGRLLAQHVIPGRDLIAAMREGRETLCGAREAATTIEMICAVFESHRLNGQRVSLPLSSRVNPLSRL